ncbi:hypothetical protein [Sphingomonas sp. RB1R13]
MRGNPNIDIHIADWKITIANNAVDLDPLPFCCSSQRYKRAGLDF